MTKRPIDVLRVCRARRRGERSARRDTRTTLDDIAHRADHCAERRRKLVADCRTRLCERKIGEAKRAHHRFERKRRSCDIVVGDDRIAHDKHRLISRVSSLDARRGDFDFRVAHAKAVVVQKLAQHTTKIDAAQRRRRIESCSDCIIGRSIMSLSLQTSSSSSSF